MTLKSKGIGNILKVFLWATIITTGLSFITTALFAFNYELYLEIENFDWFLMIFFTITYVMLIIFYLIWIFKVHRDLAQIHPPYPVTPGGALARIMIPFYNIYGMWNVYSTMYRFFDLQDETEKHGSRLQLYVPFYYFLFLIANFMGRLVSSESAGSIFRDKYEEALVLSYGLDLCLFIMFLLMVHVVTNALNTLTSEVDPETGFKLSLNHKEAKPFDYVADVIVGSSDNKIKMAEPSASQGQNEVQG